jgi:hypothetical protein
MTHLLPDKLLCHSTFTIGRNYLEKAEAASTQVFCSHHKTIKAVNLTGSHGFYLEGCSHGFYLEGCSHGFYLEGLWSLEHQNKFSLFDNNKPLRNGFILIQLARAFDIQVIGKVWKTEE